MDGQLSAALTGIHVTEEEYLELCDEDIKAELIGGVLVVSSPASVRHELVQGFLLGVLRAYVEARDLGVVLGSHSPMRLAEQYFEPDVLFVAQGRIGQLGSTFLEGPADVVVEITSPESGALDRVVKRRAYETGGVREYWLVNLDRRQADFYRLAPEGGYQLSFSGGTGEFHSEVIPGFWLKVEWLWEEPLPKVLDVLRDLGLLR